MYITIDEAQTYFDTRLHTEVWDDATVTDQTKAIITATRIIDNLQFKGCKTDSEQLNQFPRYPDTVIPVAITYAVCEIVIMLLDDMNMENEIEALRANTYNYSTLKTEVNQAIWPEHIMSGVPSAVAWRYLQPYLQSPYELYVKRIN